jgi:predicted N-acetyltransferase YhbS
VHPDIQRKGVGEALTQWGTKKADEEGLEVI